MRALLAVSLACACAAAAAAPPPNRLILDYLHSRGEALSVTAGAPVRAVYIDWRAVNWNAPDQNVKDIVDAGFNVVLLAFYLMSGPTDMLQAWASLSAAKQQAAVAYAHSKGAVVMLTAAGSTEDPFTADPASYGAAVANAALKLNLDGVDFDLENLGVGCVAAGKTDKEVVAWMATVTNAARAVLGSAAIITHAPQAPYFGSPSGSGGGNPWTGPTGCYTGLDAAAGANVSWYNVQFYSQGPTCYTSYTSLYMQSNASGACPPFPGTSVGEIAAYGVPEAKLVIGKPLDPGDAGSGYVAPAALHGFITEATAAGFPLTGVMAWSWDPATAPQWIATVLPPSRDL